MSSTLVPGTLPAAASSAPGAAIPARAPPLLRAASSRTAEAGAPGGGHGHGGPGGGTAPGTGTLRPGYRRAGPGGCRAARFPPGGRAVPR